MVTQSDALVTNLFQKKLVLPLIEKETKRLKKRRRLSKLKMSSMKMAKLFWWRKISTILSSSLTEPKLPKAKSSRWTGNKSKKLVKKHTPTSN